MKTLDELKKYIDETKDIVLFIGSNATSNVFKKMSNEDLQKFIKIHNNRFFRRKNKEYWDELSKIRQNIEIDNDNKNIKYALKLLESGLVSRIYYQDIDGLIEDSEKLVEVAGSINKYQCIKQSCKERYTLDTLPEDMTCLKCNSKIRPTLTFYEDPYDDNVETMIVDDLNNSHVVITVGLDINDSYLVDLISAFDEMRFNYSNDVKDKKKQGIEITKEEELNDKRTIVAIHDEPEDVDYNELFKCNFQSVGNIEKSFEKLLNSIL